MDKEEPPQEDVIKIEYGRAEDVPTIPTKPARNLNNAYGRWSKMPKYKLTGESETINGIAYPVYKEINRGNTRIEINGLLYPTGMTPWQEKWHRKFGIGSRLAKIALASFLVGSLIVGIGLSAHSACEAYNNYESRKTLSTQTDEYTPQGSGLEQIIEQ